MKILYSDIKPLGVPQGAQSIRDCLVELIETSDEIDIGVGYVSQSSLEELGSLLEQNPNIKRVRLTMGMYRFEGMPEKTLRLARKLNEKWQAAGRGEIRIVTPFSYHGKVYCFFKDGKPYACVTGSANLSVLKPEADTRRQYEIATLIDDPNDAELMAQHLDSLASNRCSKNIDQVDDIPVLPEHNSALDGNDKVKRLTSQDIDIYRNSKSGTSFQLPLKVPSGDHVYSDLPRSYTKSNLNVAYAAPRSENKSRDWYEFQLTVDAKNRQAEGYPAQGVPFFVVTDDGYFFKAHTTSQNNKQWSAVGDELIMGRWLKGRLAAAGLVVPVDDTQQDKDRSGMITQEMLAEYGADKLIFRKTDRKALDESTGEELDVWFLSFDPKDLDDETEKND